MGANRTIINSKYYMTDPILLITPAQHLGVQNLYDCFVKVAGLRSIFNLKHRLCVLELKLKAPQYVDERGQLPLCLRLIPKKTRHPSTTSRITTARVGCAGRPLV